VQYGLMRKDRIPEDLKKNKILYHRISTENGHSGSPLILIEKTKNQKEPELHIVAIHKGGVTL